MTTGEMIKECRKRKGMTQAALGKIVNKSSQVISNLERGYTSSLDPSDIVRISRALDVEPSLLLSYDKGLSGGGVSSNKPAGVINLSSFVRIPILGSIVAGVPQYLDTDDVSEGTVLVDKRYSTDEYFALKVHGHSMEPDLMDGDIILCHKQPQVESGEMAIVCVGDDDATVKTIREQGTGIVLVGKNLLAYTPTFYSREQILEMPIRIIGKAVQIVQRKL